MSFIGLSVWGLSVWGPSVWRLSVWPDFKRLLLVFKNDVLAFLSAHGIARVTVR
jgi:hypothetical protein